ncbi:hypothetical protein BH10ACT7_BH10ACT7_12180 [soil metagenome]
MTLDEAARVLGVAVTATPAQIEAAYRRRARETHPDRSGSDDAFIAVTAAHDLLLKAVAFERPVHAPPRPSPRLIVTWVGVALVAIFIATFRNEWPLPAIDPLLRYAAMLVGLVGYALTGRRVFLVLAVVAIAATTVLTLAFASFGGLVGLLILVAPIYGLLLMGRRLRPM